MASHRRPKRPSKTRVSVMTAAAATAVALAPNLSHADPAPTKDQVRRQIDDLHREAEEATEEYNGLQERQSGLETQVRRAQERIAESQAELVGLQESVGAIASARYRSGAIDPTLRLLLSGEPRDYLARAAALDRIEGRQREALHRVEVTRRVLEQDRAEAAGRLTELRNTRSALAAKKTEVEAKLERARRLLETLDERDRRALLAAEGSGPRSTSAPAAGPGPASVAALVPAVEAPATGRAAIAVAAAYRALGKPYVWGATGPSSFDCSGLTGWVWRQAGVSLPRTSQGQAAAGRSVPIGEIRPGDLVIYYGNATHVGVYTGGGRIVHAPKPGTNVRFAPLRSMPVSKVVRVS